MSRILIKLLLFLVIFISALNAQDLNSPEYSSDKKVTVIPNANYKAGWLHGFLFGTHWRELWTTPIEVEVLDLNKFAGGLVPVRKGGGMQTKSLRFKSPDGREWKFRSVDKDPEKVLPPDLRETFVSDVVKDQISSSNPLAPLVVAPLLKAVGVLQAEPKLVVLPDDPKLGEFRKEFGGMLGMIEIHPDEDADEGFEGAEKVMGTFKLLNRLEEKRSEKVNSKEFLKARLMDILLGDWDRHTDQWRWARYEKNGVELWHPIPRDRDQAFAKFDGIGPTIAEYYIPQLNHFDYDYPQAEDIAWSGRFLDQRFLTELTKAEWDSVANYIYKKVTDSVIVSAVRRLPKAQYEIAGDEIIQKLVSRRNLLPEFIDEYYGRVNKYVDIHCSNKDDYVEVNRLSNSETEISYYKRDKDSGGKKGTPLYHKIFDNDITKEIRVYLEDEDDKIVVKGETECSPMIRAIGGNGKDEFIDSSLVKGYFLYFTPIPDAENKTAFYDSGKKSKFTPGPGTIIDKTKVKEPADDFERYEPQLIDRGHNWIVTPELGYDSDNHIIVGGSLKLRRYNFRADPYDYQVKVYAAYATRPASYIIGSEGIFNSVFNKTGVKLSFYKSELHLTRYFGFGNETSYSNNLDDNEYYKLSQELVELYSGLMINLSKTDTINLGVAYDYTETGLKHALLLSNFPGGTYGAGKLNFMSGHASVVLDTRDNLRFPFSGFYFKLGGSINSQLPDLNNTFYKVAFDARYYATTRLFTETTASFRVRGGKVWGEYPFFKAEFLGGTDDLRGYARNRFAGDASLLTQAEFKFFLTQLNIIIPGKLGLNVFAETGRVFTDGIKSEKWHPSLGAGLWVSFLDREAVGNLVFAYSPEDFVASLKSSFSF